VAMLAGASLLAPAVLAVQGAWQPRQIDWPAITACAVALFLLVLNRMSGLVRQIGDQAAQLAAMAHHDALTGVANRRAWDGELARAVSVAHRSGAPLTVALLDLDHFKRFNDAHGHQAGDALLRDAAQAWRADLRPGDFLARYGGEEFTVLVSGLAPAQAIAVVERLKALTPGEQTFSAGVATWDGIESPAELVGRADEALYRAKRAGRDRIESSELLTPA
jgi:diguanylate cyclase (GGDEF)-like protein